MNKDEKNAACAHGEKPMMLTPPMLVNQIARLFNARMRNYDLDGVMSQDSARQIMRTLSREDGCSQLDLVHKTHLKAPTVSVTLKRMEEEGLVRREQDRMDLRVIRVFLSEKGQEHNRTVQKRLNGLDCELMQGFTEEETEQLLHFLERMRDNILPEHHKNNT
ncbi:MAG: MarR family transcriptional regulator [Clostridia bacterium]|nr:MarR family transcriptional regulator [Clostridia bacterium]